MKVSIFNTDGKKSKNSVELNDEIFAIEPNEVVIYEDVRRIMAAKRQGTHSTKGRSEVTGSTKKLYRQKGTGNARRGNIKSPLLRKGGTVFGPKPRKYTFKLNKKVVQLARKSALSMKMASESILVTTDFTYETPSTKAVSAMLSAFELDGKKVTILIAESDVIVFKSARNIPRVQVVVASSLNTYQILNSDVILIQESAVNTLENSVYTQSDEEVAA
jgi:large subunit ribosomal protein L4